MAHKRTIIRKYIIDMLTDPDNDTGVGKKVFPNRPNPVFIHEVPCICVHFGPEPVDILTGDKNNPHEYERAAQLNIDIMVGESINPDEDPLVNQDTEDKLDAIAWKVEMLLADDYTLAKRLEGFNPNSNTNGDLLLGSSLVNTNPYNIDVDGERRIAAQRLSFTLTYDTAAYLDLKLKNFNSYNAEFYEVKDGEKTDHILIAAEGEI